MHIFIAGVFLVSGCCRRNYLSKFSQSQLYFSNTSRLFKFKLFLWLLLVIMDFGVVVNIFMYYLDSTPKPNTDDGSSASSKA